MGSGSMLLVTTYKAMMPSLGGSKKNLTLCGPQSGGELLLGQLKTLPGLSRVCTSHVTNGHIGIKNCQGHLFSLADYAPVGLSGSY